MQSYVSSLHTAHCVCYTGFKRPFAHSPGSVLPSSDDRPQRRPTRRHRSAVPAAVWRAAALQRRPPPPGPPPRTGRAHSPSLPPAWGLRSCFHTSSAARPVSPAPPGSPAALFPNSRFSISRLCLSNTIQSKDLFLPSNESDLPFAPC